MNDLLRTFDKYSTDKGNIKHRYDRIYESIFSKIRYEPINILEIGIYKGASAQAFLEYFPNATVYGIDVFVRMTPDQIPALKDPRVHWLKADSTSPELKETIQRNWPNVKFDIIIDDGLHTPDANRLTFLNTIDFLKEDGVYFTEDVWPLDLMTNDEISRDSWLSTRSEFYTKIKYDQYLNEISKYNYELKDNRKCGKRRSPVIGDSAIMMVTKNGFLQRFAD